MAMTREEAQEVHAAWQPPTMLLNDVLRWIEAGLVLDGVPSDEVDRRIVRIRAAITGSPPDAPERSQV